jgi:hypothetical protein
MISVSAAGIELLHNHRPPIHQVTEGISDGVIPDAASKASRR